MTPRKKAKAKKTGRPSSFRDEFVAQARAIRLSGGDINALAVAFGVSKASVATWRKNMPEFRDAVTSSSAPFWTRDDCARARKAKSQRAAYHASGWRRALQATRARIYIALRGETSGKAIARLPYSPDELKRHLESHWRDDMSWDNYGAWHVDHVRPCASFDLSQPAQFAECWALSNLQPLWAAENMLKGARYASA